MALRNLSNQICIEGQEVCRLFHVGTWGIKKALLDNEDDETISYKIADKAFKT